MIISLSFKTPGRRSAPRGFLALVLFLLLAPRLAWSQPDTTASRALIQRIIPAHATAFLIEALPHTAKDTFELESRGSHIILRGNTGVAIASALYYYLETYCHCQITWNGSN